MHCHNNPTLRDPKDKLATVKTSVSKYGNLKLHENSACHKALMDAIEQNLRPLKTRCGSTPLRHLSCSALISSDNSLTTIKFD